MKKVMKKINALKLILIFTIVNIGFLFSMEDKNTYDTLESIKNKKNETRKRENTDENHYGKLPLNKEVIYEGIPEKVAKEISNSNNDEVTKLPKLNLYGRMPEIHHYVNTKEINNKRQTQINPSINEIKTNQNPSDKNYVNVPKKEEGMPKIPIFENFDAIDKIVSNRKSINPKPVYNKKEENPMMDFLNRLVLINAIKDKQLEHAASLIKSKKINLDAQDGNNNTALILASNLGLLEIVKLLIKYEANLDLVNKDGETALMKACQEGYPEIVEILIKNKANKETKNNKNETALDIAKNKNRQEIIKKLEDSNKFSTIKRILTKKDIKK